MALIRFLFTAFCGAADHQTRHCEQQRQQYQKGQCDQIPLTGVRFNVASGRAGISIDCHPGSTIDQAEPQI